MPGTIGLLGKKIVGACTIVVNSGRYGQQTGNEIAMQYEKAAHYYEEL